MEELQLSELFPEQTRLHRRHGDKNLMPIFGAGQITKPEICLVFMNPTDRNVSSQKDWKGIRAPWLGTKNIWNMLARLGLISQDDLLDSINTLKSEEWNEDFSYELYSQVAKQSIFITNIAKCTTKGATHISNEVYREFLPSTLKELKMIKPKKTFLFGNQVSSIILSKNVSVSDYQNDECEILSNGNYSHQVYPTYYPVGQGMRNVDKAVKRIKSVLN